MAREDLAGFFRLHAGACRSMGSPFYGDLIERLAADIDAGGPVATVLEPYEDLAFDDVVALRLLGGLHRAALAGSAPALGAHFPTTGGDGDAAAAAEVIVDMLRDPPESVLDALTRPPQTNEVGRSVALVGGLLEVAREHGLPVRLLEIGSSAGLNLRVDAYWYEQAGRGWGDSASPVRFVDLWEEGAPPLDAELRIATRRGCDQDPIDATDPEAALTLLGYVWPGQDERFAILRAALEVAARVPVVIDHVDAAEWLARQLEDPQPGVATVVMHSIMWQYLPPPTQRRVEETISAAGARATSEAPVAWLCFEPNPDVKVYPDLRLTTWPGGTEQVLARAGFHLGPVTWLAP